LLGQENMNAGGAASIINFSHTAMGALGMMLGTIGWRNNIEGLGYVIFIGMGFSIILWLAFINKGYQLKGL
jgi:DHA1 family bicyclomycin/chloramphenicol resistance-like MFS transporter